MAFHELSFAKRYTEMGDASEAVFERVYGRGFVRWGLNRPPLNMRMLPPEIRYAPDYLTSSGFVECLGCGRGGVLKLKFEKLNCGLFWHRTHPLTYFVWDSHKSEYAYVGYELMSDIILDAEHHGVIAKAEFHDGKIYWPIPRNLIPSWESLV